MENIKLLISRIKWPSGMVRERACSAIADLLTDSKWNKVVKESLLDWLNEQELESIIVNGLIPFLYAKTKCKDFKTPIKELTDTCKKQSILFWMILDELTAESLQAPNWTLLNSGTVPTSFKVNPFFRDYVRNFIPPTYMDTALKIEKLSGIPFVTQWAFEWQNIVEKTSKIPSTDPLTFWGLQYSEHFGAIDFEMSEIFRSAFLRTLAWCIMNDSLLIHEARFLALKTCPVDFGLAQLQPNSRPTWWPNGTEEPGIWLEVESLWNQRKKENNWILGEATGRIKEEKSICDLEIFGFLIVEDSTQPIESEKLSYWCQYQNVVDHGEPSLFLEGIIRKTSMLNHKEDFSGNKIVSLSTQIWPHTTPRWQFWRMYRGIWIPTPFIARNDLTFSCSEKGLHVNDEEDFLGVWKDWTGGLKEKLTANLSPATGQYLKVNRKRIEEIVDNTNSTYCWLCCLKTFHRKSDFEEFTKSTSYKIYKSEKGKV